MTTQEDRATEDLEKYNDLIIGERLPIYKVKEIQLLDKNGYCLIGCKYAVKWKDIVKIDQSILLYILELMEKQFNLQLDE